MEDNKTPRNSRRKCSFCGRSENEVGFLITGMNGCICDSCSEQAYEIMQEAMHQKKGAPGELNLKELPKPKEIKSRNFLTNTLLVEMTLNAIFPLPFTIITSVCSKKWIRMI